MTMPSPTEKLGRESLFLRKEGQSLDPKRPNKSQKTRKLQRDPQEPERNRRNHKNDGQPPTFFSQKPPLSPPPAPCAPAGARRGSPAPRPMTLGPAPGRLSWPELWCLAKTDQRKRVFGQKQKARNFLGVWQKPWAFGSRPVRSRPPPPLFGQNRGEKKSRRLE